MVDRTFVVFQSNLTRLFSKVRGIVVGTSELIVQCDLVHASRCEFCNRDTDVCDKFLHRAQEHVPFIHEGGRSHQHKLVHSSSFSAVAELKVETFKS